MNTQDNSRYHEVYARALHDPEGFWEEAAREIDWMSPAKKIFDPAQGLYGRWFPGAVVNTCYNALDRHVAGGRADQLALIHDSPLTGSVTKFTYAEMLHEVKTLAARHDGFRRRKRRPRHHLYADGAGGRGGDAGLRADRRGAFGGVRRLCGQGTGDPDRRRRAKTDFLRELRDRARPHRAYKPLLDEAIKLAGVKPQACIILQRPQQTCELVAGRDHDWAALRSDAIGARKSRRLRARARDRSALYPLYVGHDGKT